MTRNLGGATRSNREDDTNSTNTQHSICYNTTSTMADNNLETLANDNLDDDLDMPEDLQLAEANLHCSLGHLRN